MALIPPFFADTVVAVGYEQQNKIVWGASGFFYCHMIKEDKGRVYLVTNKHVLQNQPKIFLRINPKALGSPKGYSLNLIDATSGKQLWKGHYNSKVDVAVIPINFAVLQQQEMQVSYFLDTKHVVNTKRMKDIGQADGDSVFVLGFPVSLVGDKSNSVVVRSGTIARIKDTLQSPVRPFLIDTTVFPGNSGGPVVNRPEFVAIQGTKTINEASLIGIVASYVPYRDIAVSRQTGNIRVVFEENSGLSNVFSVDCIKTAISSFEKELKSQGSPKLAQPETSEEAAKNPVPEDNPNK